MRLLLLRHAQTPANVEGVVSTAAPGPGLTELGVQQAEAVVDALRHEPIEAIYVSGLVRTRLTAAPIARARGLEPVELDGLNEIEAGDIEDRADLPSVRLYMRTIWSWLDGELDRPIPGAFDGHTFFRRFDAAVERIADGHGPDATVLAVSHGASIRAWTGARAANLPPGFTGEQRLENTGLVVVEGMPGSWRALSWAGIPLGGPEFADTADRDVTGEMTEAQVAED